MSMYVIKRSGKKELMHFDKITTRNSKLCSDLSIDPIKISQKVVESLKSGMKTVEIDVLSAETALYMSTYDPEYEILAKRIIVSNMHKSTESLFSGVTQKLRDMDLLNDDYYDFVVEHREELDEICDFTRDYNFSYHGYKVIEKSYSMKDKNGNILERPQHIWLRTAVFLRMPDINAVKELYYLSSCGFYTHASPTLFNSGLKYPQLSSCFLLSMKDDLMNMYETLKQAAIISKFSGGLGINISMIRSKNSRINSTGGLSNGIVPYMKVWNETARYVNQSGKRKGAVAIYLEPHHADIFDFLKVRKNNTKETEACLDLHIALWVSDLFMRRVKEKGVWSLFDPKKVPELHSTFGEEFERIYEKAESDKLYEQQVEAQFLFKEIMMAQIETGEPYFLFKDTINRKSNQKNVGVIRGSNLCTEIVEYTDENNIAVCNLCSISIPAFVENNNINYEKLGVVTEFITETMNMVIDKNFYPVENANSTNMKNRPIGIGIQGLADVFQMLNISWDDEMAREINKKIYAVIYYFALKKSMELAKRDGKYQNFDGSPYSMGCLHPDMSNVEPINVNGMMDWKSLKNDIIKYGVRNSLLTTQMPTVSTSQILGNNESMEPCHSNIYMKRALSGDFPIVNKYLYKKLLHLNMWNKNIIDEIIKNNGSIQHIKEIPQDIKNVFRTVWEIKMKTLVDMAIDRGVYIDQSQSFNVFMEEPTMEKLSSMFMYSWENGIKTGMYYLRRKSHVNPIKFSLMNKENEQVACKRGDDSCTSCSA